MPLSVQDLQDIAAICEHGSFRKAAAKIGISQPTLSERVTQMERRLGAVLFDRGQGRSRPTQLAQTIVGQSRGLLRQLGGLVNQVGALSAGERGLVRLGFGPLTAFRMLDDLVHRIRESTPGITLVVRINAAGKLLESLAAGEIDLAYCDGDPGLMRPEFTREFVLRDRLGAIVKPGHPLAGVPAIPLASVFDHPVALPNLDPRYLDIIREASGVDPLALPGAVYCSSLWLLRSLAESGHYSTVLPVFGVAEALRSGTLIEIPLTKRIEHEVCMYTNRWSLPLPSIEAVTDIVREQGREIALEIGARAS